MYDFAYVIYIILTFLILTKKKSSFRGNERKYGAANMLACKYASNTYRISYNFSRWGGKEKTDN